MNHKSEFFKYVIPSIIAFAMSGIYAIVAAYFDKYCCYGYNLC